MSRKLLILLVAFVIGAFWAPMTMAASLGGVAADELGLGSTAGTILNPEGKGDALIFPYYDVRLLNGKTQDNYFAIFNDSMTNGIDDPTAGIAAKLRFREWDKSLEVYDINIWLSCYDVWVGLIQQGPNSLAYLWSPDWVIIDAPAASPVFLLQTALNVTSATGALVGRPFRPQLIPIPNDRTLLGYFEVIGEERTACKASNVSGTGANRTGYVNRTGADAPNYLEGYAYIVRVDEGVAAGYNASAFANFARNIGTLYFPPESDQPNFTNCEDTIDQVEFQLAKRFLNQGYSVESNINAKFSAIITFPTKHFHFGGILTGFPLNSNAVNYGVAEAPRGEPFNAARANDGEEVSVTIWDRNEVPFSVPPGFESPAQGSDKIKLKYEVNIVGLYPTAGAVTITNPRDNLGLPTGGPDSGWFKIDLNGTTAGYGTGTHFKTLPDGNTKLQAFNWFGNFFATYVGLPALGLVYQEFSNNKVGGVYGEILPIFYEVDWQNPVVEP